MGLKFDPPPGQILICEFPEGFKEPEMVKTRPVMVVSPRLKQRNGLCSVVPLSTTPPDRIQNWHYLLKLDRPLPSPWSADEQWVKADMLTTVSYHRLNLIPTKRDHEGKRKYLTIIVKHDELKAIRKCLLHGLGLGQLTNYL